MGWLLRWLLFCFLLVASVTDHTTDLLDESEENRDSEDEPWDINGPCQQFIDDFSLAQTKYLRCIANESSPSKTCSTTCGKFYFDFRKAREIFENTKTTTRAGQLCARAVYDNYPISINERISKMIEDSWTDYKCHYCIGANNTELPHVRMFNDKMNAFHTCVHYNVDSHGNSTVCSNCSQTFNLLFNYYWDVYADPDQFFCMDVEAVMNDTTHLWNRVWNCTPPPDRFNIGKNIYVESTALVLLIFTFFFYAGSYFQTDPTARQLVRYSRLREPEPARSRLLSTVGSEASFPVVHSRTESNSSGNHVTFS